MITSNQNDYFIWVHNTKSPDFTNDLCKDLTSIGDLCVVGGYGKRTERQTTQFLNASYEKKWNGFDLTFGGQFANNVLKSERGKTHYKYMDYESLDPDYHPTFGRLTADDGNLGTTMDHTLSIANIAKAMYIGNKVKCTSSASNAGYCNEGKQALYIRETYAAGNKAISYTELGLYVQLGHKTSDGNLTAGLRMDMDKGTGNNLIAPRVSYTVKQDKVNWNLGLNRYYSLKNGANELESLHGYTTEYLTPNSVDADGNTTYGENWSDDDSGASGGVIGYKGLKNPFTDEFSIGLGVGTKKTGLVRVKGILRRSKDEFTTSSIGVDEEYNTIYALNNDGQTSNDSISLDYVKQYKNSVFSIGSTFSSLDTNNETFLHGAISKRKEKKVLLINKDVKTVMSESEVGVQRRLFSKPAIINFSAISSWQGGNLITMFLGKYTPHYASVIKKSNTSYNNIWYDTYKVSQYSDAINLDFNAGYKLPESWVGNKNIKGTLSIGNIFGSKAPRGSEALEENYITQDRTIKIGVEYKF